MNARFRSLSSNIEQIVAPQNKRNGKSQSIGDDQNQWTNIELQRQLELANIMLEEEAMDQNLIESNQTDDEQLGSGFNGKNFDDKFSVPNKQKFTDWNM